MYYYRLSNIFFIISIFKYLFFIPVSNLRKPNFEDPPLITLSFKNFLAGEAMGLWETLTHRLVLIKLASSIFATIQQLNRMVTWFN